MLVTSVTVDSYARIKTSWCPWATVTLWYPSTPTPQNTNHTYPQGCIGPWVKILFNCTQVLFQVSVLYSIVFLYVLLDTAPLHFPYIDVTYVMHWEQVSYEKITVQQGDATVYQPEVQLFSITHLLLVHYPAYITASGGWWKLLEGGCEIFSQFGNHPNTI